MLLLGTAALHSSGGAAAASRDELHLVVGESPGNLNPLLATTVDEQTLASLAFDTLLNVKPDGMLEPSLATGEPTLANGGIARDGRTVTFHLRSGVRWQDGKPFTSGDVAFTIRTILDPKTPIADRTGYSDIASVDVPNPLTIVFHLKKPYAPFVTYVSTQFPIVPEHLLAHSANIGQDPFNAHPVGTGPYAFVRQSRGDRIEYVANHGYWRGAPKIEKLVVYEIPDVSTQAIELRDGQLDYALVESSQFAQLRKVPSLVSGTQPVNDFVAYAINVERPIVSDVRVRRAISMAIDRETIVRDVTFGTGTAAYADLVASLWRSPEPRNPYAYDPKAANALLDEAGWKRGTDGVRVRGGKRLHLVVIDFAGSVSGRTIDAQVQQMLAAVGIEAEFKYFSPSIYYSPAASGGPIAKGDFDLAGYSFNANPDPLDDELYTCAAREPNGYNAARYCSSRMDALQAASLAELDAAKRRSLVAKIERLAVTDVPYVFLYHTPFRYVESPALRDARPSFGTVLYRIWDWSFAN
jgi:peptide/nickel transport system substrate-binding protein